jgi:hypothetical protein
MMVTIKWGLPWNPKNMTIRWKGGSCNLESMTMVTIKWRFWF